jgi:hypothetical protein
VQSAAKTRHGFHRFHEFTDHSVKSVQNPSPQRAIRGLRFAIEAKSEDKKNKLVCRLCVANNP